MESSDSKGGVDIAVVCQTVKDYPTNRFLLSVATIPRDLQLKSDWVKEITSQSRGCQEVDHVLQVGSRHSGFVLFGIYTKAEP